VKFKKYSDTGHGWLKVSLKLIYELNIQNNISSCSYMHKTNAYLEEDCDMGTFFKAYLKKDELAWEDIAGYIDYMPQSNKQSRIRNYESFSVKEHNNLMIENRKEVRAKILRTSKDSDTKTALYYATGLKLSDSFNNVFTVYYRGKPEFYVDIPINKNDIGIIFNGYFCFIGKAHPYCLDLKDLIELAQNRINKDNYSIVRLCDDLVNSFKHLEKGWN
jgi:hypothetical protein